MKRSIMFAGTGLFAAGIVVLNILYPAEDPIDYTLSETEALLMSTPFAPVFKMQKAHFPHKFTAFTFSLGRNLNRWQLNSQDAREKALESGMRFSDRLTEEHAAFIATSPETNIRKLHGKMAAVLQELSTSPTFCAAYGGAGALSVDIPPMLLEHLPIDEHTQLIATMYEAMAAGRDTPVTYSEMTAQDFNVSIDELQAATNLTRGDIKAVLDYKFGDETLCESLISLHQFLSGAQSKASVKLAASIAFDLVSK